MSALAAASIRLPMCRHVLVHVHGRSPLSSRMGRPRLQPQHDCGTRRSPRLSRPALTSSDRGSRRPDHLRRTALARARCIHARPRVHAHAHTRTCACAPALLGAHAHTCARTHTCTHAHLRLRSPLPGRVHAARSYMCVHTYVHARPPPHLGACAHPAARSYVLGGAAKKQPRSELAKGAL